MSTSLIEAPERTDSCDDPARRRDESTSQIVAFHLGQEWYGLSIKHVQEIILPGAITPMPSVPSYVVGLSNLRGDVIPVLDLSLRFGLERHDKLDSTRIVVLNIGDKTIGVVVDAVDEVLRIRDSQIQPVNQSFSGWGRAYVEGFVKLRDRLVILLRADSILDDVLADSITSAPTGASPRVES